MLAIGMAWYGTAWHNPKEGRCGGRKGYGFEGSTSAGAHWFVDGEASVADAAVLGLIGWAHQVSTITERGRRAAIRARAPFAG